MDFSLLLECLVRRARAEVRNGALTERGLARRAGLSQPHVHNVLSGVRILTPRTADLILAALEIAVEDLLEDVRREDEADSRGRDDRRVSQPQAEGARKRWRGRYRGLRRRLLPN